MRPVGSTSEEPVDVRILASTNRDPAAALRRACCGPTSTIVCAVTSLIDPAAAQRAATTSRPWSSITSPR